MILLATAQIQPAVELEARTTNLFILRSLSNDTQKQSLLQGAELANKVRTSSSSDSYPDSPCTPALGMAGR